MYIQLQIHIQLIGNCIRELLSTSILFFAKKSCMLAIKTCADYGLNTFLCTIVNYTRVYAIYDTSGDLIAVDYTYFCPMNGNCCFCNRPTIAHPINVA